MFICLVFTSCTTKTSNIAGEASNEILPVIYAEGFAVHFFDQYKKVIVYSPWKNGSELARYYLVNNSQAETPSDGIKIVTPIQSIACGSVTHFEFLDLIDELESITGICSPNIVYNQRIRDKTTSGDIADLGDSFNIDVEKTMLLRPNALMISGYNQNDTYAQRIAKAGIPVIFNNEWMESNLLARAEWIKFIATFYNKEQLADSIFNAIATRYNTIRDKAQHVSNKPRVMTGSNFRGTWYMPSGRNFMGQLLVDAGADYFYANDTTSGSLPLNVETVLKNFSACDYWLNCSFNSVEELMKADSKHGLFNPVKNNQVYNFNKRLLPSTANDFWESAIARPDLLLSDVIAILHPEILPDYELIFATKLSPSKQ